MIKANPQKLIAEHMDWRFINELKRELKAHVLVLRRGSRFVAKFFYFRTALIYRQQSAEHRSFAAF